MLVAQFYHLLQNFLLHFILNCLHFHFCFYFHFENCFHCLNKHCHLNFCFLVAFVLFLFQTGIVSCNSPFLRPGGTGDHMISRSIYNVSIDTVYTYDIPIESAFLQLSNDIRHIMPSTDTRLELKVKNIDGSDRLTAGCVLMDLASPAVSRTAVYANGLTWDLCLSSTTEIFVWLLQFNICSLGYGWWCLWFEFWFGVFCANLRREG
jgi:hypothetical protein